MMSCLFRSTKGSRTVHPAHLHNLYPDNCYNICTQPQDRHLASLASNEFHAYYNNLRPRTMSFLESRTWPLL